MNKTTADAPTVPDAPPAKAFARARRVVRIVFAFTLVAIGLLGIILPLIPGWPIAAIGLSILAAEYVWARRLLARFRRKKRKKPRRGWFRRKSPPSAPP